MKRICIERIVLIAVTANEFRSFWEVNYHVVATHRAFMYKKKKIKKAKKKRTKKRSKEKEMWYNH